MTPTTVQKRVYNVDAARLSYLTRILGLSSQDILAPYIRTLYSMVGTTPDKMNISTAKLYVEKMAEGNDDNDKLSVA